MKTNIGKEFLKLIDNSFPPTHPLAKAFNRNTIKLSYSCMPSIGSVIARDSKSKLKQAQLPEPRQCNCQAAKTCPVGGTCLTPSVIYQAEVTRQDNGTKETYIGLTKDPLKTRINQHNSDFSKSKYITKTALSKNICIISMKA